MSSRHVAPLVVPVVDTTGCGDAFTGALVAALAKGAPIEAAAQLGAAAGAYAAGGRGAQPSYPSASQLSEFLVRHGLPDLLGEWWGPASSV